MIDVDLALAIQHLKADGVAVEQALIEQYITSAVSVCEGYCNRKFYNDADAQTADRADAMAELIVIQAARDAALAETEDCDTIQIIWDRYKSDWGAIKQRVNGIVVDGTIMAAILLILGHLYRNRQEVVAGQYAGATQLPAGARRILEPYLWIGDLA